jgi:hypothetical protein
VIEMGEPKPTASLSSMLLARKGAARPAMRRPSIVGNASHATVGQDDLGWNDMGYDVDPSPSTPMDYDHDSSYNPLANAVPDMKPEVRQQQERIAEQLQVKAEAGFSVLEGLMPQAGSEPEPEFEAPQTVTPALIMIAPVQKSTTDSVPKKRAAPGQKGKAAFTLRLDNERHLKLRLACAVSNRSAQMLVTEALDNLLDTMPEISQLVANVKAR